MPSSKSIFFLKESTRDLCPGVSAACQTCNSGQQSVILTLMNRLQFSKQTQLLEVLMEQEFKNLFFLFKSLENPPLHLNQPLNRLMIQATHSGSSCSITSLRESLS